MIVVNRLRVITERESTPPVDDLQLLSTNPSVDEERVSRSTAIELIFNTDIKESTITPLTVIVEMDDLLMVREVIPADEEENVLVNREVKFLFDHEVNVTTISDSTILIEREV